MKMKRYECVLSNRNETLSATIITDVDPLYKGAEVTVQGNQWSVKIAVPADTDFVQFGDILHEAKPTRTRTKK